MAQQPPEAPEPSAPGSDAPRPAAPRPGPPPSSAPRPAGLVAAGIDASTWGRVDSEGVVYVRARDGSERQIGQWPDSSTSEALTMYVHRFEGLAVEVELLEQRVRTGALAPDEARTVVAQVRDSVHGAPAVGDLEGLTERLDALGPLLDEERQRRQAARAAKQERASTAKEAIVAEAEQLAGSENWRAGADRLSALMDSWKAQPRIAKADDDALWRRFSAARSTYNRRRKQQLAKQHEQRAQSRVTKDQLAAEAESLADSTDWGATARRFRDLMGAWKAAGPAPRVHEEKLWRRFRTAQDTFFTRRDEDNAKVDAEFAANAEVKRAVLAEAEQLVPVTDLASARDTFRELGERWEDAGKVPRDQMRELEGRMRAVETALRAADEERWRRSNPEARARAEATVGQLESLLVDLRDREAKAEAAGDARRLREAREAIEAREAWLEQARRALADFTP